MAQSSDFLAAACVEWHPVFSLYHAIGTRAKTSPPFLSRTLQVNMAPPRTPTSPSILAARRSLLDVNDFAASIQRLQQVRIPLARKPFFRVYLMARTASATIRSSGSSQSMLSRAHADRRSARPLPRSAPCRLSPRHQRVSKSERLRVPNVVVVTFCPGVAAQHAFAVLLLL
jgi:hypothetical protein